MYIYIIMMTKRIIQEALEKQWMLKHKTNNLKYAVQCRSECRNNSPMPARGLSNSLKSQICILLFTEFSQGVESLSDKVCI